MRTCIHAHMHTCIYTRTHIHIYIIHTCILTYIHVYAHTSTQPPVHTYRCLRARHLPSRRPRARHLAAVPRPARQVKRRKLRPQPHSDDDDDVSGEAGAATHRAHAQAPTHGGTRARRRHAKACCESRGARQSSCEGRQWAAGTSPGIAYGDTGVA